MLNSVLKKKLSWMTIQWHFKSLIIWYVGKVPILKSSQHYTKSTDHKVN